MALASLQAVTALGEQKPGGLEWKETPPTPLGSFNAQCPTWFLVMVLAYLERSHHGKVLLDCPTPEASGRGEGEDSEMWEEEGDQPRGHSGLGLGKRTAERGRPSRMAPCRENTHEKGKKSGRPQWLMPGIPVL